MNVYTYQIGFGGNDLKISALAHSETVAGKDLAEAVQKAKEITQTVNAPVDANIVRLLNDDGLVMWVRPRNVL